MADIAKSLRQIGGESLAGGGTFQGTRTYSPPLKPKAPQGAKPPVVGKGRTPASTSGGGSDLVEASFSARTYWPTKTVQSSDGLFVFEVKPVKKVTWQSGATMTLAEPPA